MKGQRGIELTKTVVVHIEMLTALQTEGESTSHQLERTLDYSRATINRHLTTLRNADLITTVDGNHALTDFGAIILQEVKNLCQELNVPAQRPDLVEQLHVCPVDFEIGLLAGATVTTATPEDPYQMHDRYLGFWRDTERVKGARSISVIPPDIIEELKPKLRGTVEVDSIWTPQAATQYFERYPEMKSAWMEGPQAQIRITNEPIPVQFGVFDNRLAFTIHDDETGYPRTLVDTDNLEAIEWAHRLYRYYCDRSQTLESWLDTAEKT